VIIRERALYRIQELVVPSNTSKHNGEVSGLAERVQWRRSSKDRGGTRSHTLYCTSNWTYRIRREGGRKGKKTKGITNVCANLIIPSMQVICMFTNWGHLSQCQVFLGDPHTCSCAGFSKDKELCVHILWWVRASRVLGEFCLIKSLTTGCCSKDIVYHKITPVSAQQKLFSNNKNSST